MTTTGQKRALRELCALARTALDVCDLLAARGEEHDDRPRMYLASLERWTRGAETGPQLAARTRAMNAWGDTASYGDSSWDAENCLQRMWWLALGWLVDARADLMANPGHAHHTPRVCRELAGVVVMLTDYPPADASAMVAETLRGHRERIAGEWATVVREASAARAKVDKAAAERALGTLPGMVTT